MLYTCKWTSALCFSLVSQEFHLEYDKLEERPHVPTTFNYNPAQQAFWSWVRQRQQTASRPAWPQTTWFYSSTSGLGLREGEGGGGGLHLENWGEGPCLKNYVLPEHKTSIYFHSVFKFPSYVFFSSSPSISFRAGSMFCLLLWWKAPFGVCLESLKLQYSTQTHPLVLKKNAVRALFSEVRCANKQDRHKDKSNTCEYTRAKENAMFIVALFSNKRTQKLFSAFFF